MTSKELYSWLSGHPLINLNGLCKEVGIDRANYIKARDAEKELKKEVLQKFIDTLMDYGISGFIKTRLKKEYDEPEANEIKKHMPEEVRDKLLKEISDTEAELKSPPKNPLIGLKVWVRVREEKIKRLKQLV